MDRKKILPFCDKYNINLEYLEICREFIMSVVSKILDNYLGKELMDTNEICENHFNFWWNKVSDIFEKHTSLNFKESNKAKDYFKKILFRMLYNSKLDNIDAMITSSIVSMFNFGEYSDKDFDVIISVNNLFLNEQSTSVS